MMLLDAIQKTSLILPEHKEEFLKYLKNFPDGIQKWLYAENITDADSLYQGDILINIPTCFIDNDGDTIVGEDVVSLISNTCDMQRDRNDFIIVSPIVFFKEYKESFINTKIGIENTLNDIRKNRIFSYFYLPPKKYFSESFIDFSRMIAISSPYLNKIKASIPEKCLLSLSPYGFYLFLIKLTFHFARMEKPTEP
jgi:hypothetical protein